jgi:predicted nucleic acid-binding protein
MPRKSVYLETSVIGYATSRASRDLIVAARQSLTRAWFSTAGARYDLFVSQLVMREASSGDEEAARERLRFLQGIPLLAITDEVGVVAAELVDAGAVPRRSAEDALHIGLAAAHGIEFLLTWNCRHIANAVLRQAIERTCRATGYEPPVICTPEELMNDDGA